MNIIYLKIYYILLMNENNYIQKDDKFKINNIIKKQK
jgi:hypothetical protein